MLQIERVGNKLRVRAIEDGAGLQQAPLDQPAEGHARLLAFGGGIHQFHHYRYIRQGIGPGDCKGKGGKNRWLNLGRNPSLSGHLILNYFSSHARIP